MATERTLPTFKVEQRVLDAGFKRVCGIDEAGRGPLMGPVVSAAVVLNPEDIPDDINDSKQLSEKKREALYDEINNRAVAVSVGMLTHTDINNTNILAATLASMCNAVRALDPVPDFLLIDGNQPLSMNIMQASIVDGDKYCLSIAAASIIAKVTRDRLVKEYGKEYPMYKWAKNKGYGTKEHKEAIIKYGVSPYHRVKFKGVKEYIIKK